MTTASVIAVLGALLLVGLAASVRILKQYERGVLFRLGRVNGGARGPGLIFIIPLIDRVYRVSMRIVTMPIQSQGIITRDNVSVDVSAVAYYCKGVVRVRPVCRPTVCSSSTGWPPMRPSIRPPLRRYTSAWARVPRRFTLLRGR